MAIAQKRAKRLKIDHDEVARKFILENEDQEGLTKTFINKCIGFGVFAEKTFYKGEFLLEYPGEFITSDEGKKRQKSYDESLGSFLFFYNKHCIDGTHASRLGKYVNDSPVAFSNCKMRALTVNSRVHFCLFVLVDQISPGTELRYSYGDVNLPWRCDKRTRNPYVLPLKASNILSLKNEKQSTDVLTTLKGSSNIKDVTPFHINLPANFSEKIGEGASATIFKYICNDKIKAVKVFKQQIARRKLHKVVESLSKLKHKNIVCFYGFSLKPSALVFEYCQLNLGGEVVHNAAQMVSILNENEEFVFAQRLDMVKQATSGLKALHDQGIVHKDFKPSNLLICGTADRVVVKVADFDDMYDIKGTITSTLTNMNQGLFGMTLAYTAAEICLQQVRTVSLATDVYSWAIAVFELFADVTSPWSSALAIISDGLIVEALKKGMRPHVEDLQQLYAKNECNFILPIISSAWHTDQHKRPTISQILLMLDKDYEKMISTGDAISPSPISRSQYKSKSVGSEKNGNVPEPNQKKTDYNLALDSERDANIPEANQKKTDYNLALDSEKDANIPVANQKKTDYNLALDSERDANIPEANQKKTDYNLALNVNWKRNIRASTPTNVVPGSENEVDLEEEKALFGDSGLESSQSVVLVNAYDEDLTESESISTSDSNFNPETSDESSDSYDSAKSPELPPHIKSRIQLPLRIKESKNVQSKSLFDFEDSEEDDDLNMTISSIVERILPSQNEVQSDFPDVIHMDENEKNDIIPDDDNGSSARGCEESAEKNNFLGRKDDATIDQKKNSNAGNFTDEQHKDGRKMHCCYLCQQWVYRIPRHFKLRHKNHEEIKKILQLPKKQQVKEFAILRRKGDFEANMSHARDNTEYISVVRKSKPMSVANYTPCINCFGVYNNKTLHRHLDICQAKKKSSSQSNSTNVKASKMLLQESLAKDSKFKDLKAQLLSRMMEDEVFNILKNDDGVLLYGYTLFEKGGDTAFNEISGKLRGIGRLILHFRKVTGIQDATAFSIIDPGNWDSIISAIKDLAEHKGNDAVGVPSLLLRVGRSLEAIACAKRAWGIRTKNKEVIEDARLFLELFKEYWHIYSKHALSTIQSRKDKTPELLPLTADVHQLRDYLLDQFAVLTASDVHDRGMTLHEWSWLQKIIVVRIITFNARRGGESTKILVSDWNRCEQWKRQEDIELIQDPVEKVLAKRLEVLYVKGKRKRRVPVIFTEELQKGIRILLETRDKMGVSSENPFLFPRPSRGSMNPIRGWDAVHEVALKANLKKPELITSTKIRKHMATVLQLLDMTKGELNWVSDHLGHSVDVHKAWYRQEESTIELTKVAKLLMAKDRGEVLQNKKITDLCAPSSNLPSIIKDSQGMVEDKRGSLTRRNDKKGTQESTIHDGDVDFQAVTRKTSSVITHSDNVEKNITTSKEKTTIDTNEGEMKRRIAYSTEEMTAIKTFFASQITNKNVPGVLIVEAARKKYSILQRRSISSIRSKVHSIIKQSKE